MTTPLTQPTGNKRAVLFVSCAGGPPTGWPFIVREYDGAFWCTTYRSSPKMSPIAASDRAVAVLFEQESLVRPYAIAEGTVAVVEPTPDLVARWFGGDASPDWRSGRLANRLLSGKRVFLKIVPDRPLAEVA